MADRVGLDRYEKGGYWRVDDRSGARVRAYDTREEWNGAIVDKDDWEARHPQEFLRSVRDDQSVPKPRPVPPLEFVGPLITTVTVAAPAGATVINVELTVRFSFGDTIALMLDNLDRWMTTVNAVVNMTQLQLTAPLPFSISVDADVIDYSAVAQPAL